MLKVYSICAEPKDGLVRLKNVALIIVINYGRVIMKNLFV